jgi:hypothetical protein
MPAVPTIDATGQPIVTSAGEPLTVDEGFDQALRYYGNGRETYELIATDAGHCMRTISCEIAELINREPHDLCMDDISSWTTAVFELAWKRIPGSPLGAKKYAWIRDVPYEVSGFTDNRWVGASIDLLAGIPDCPIHWYSVIDDLFSASAAAIDILASDLSAYFRASRLVAAQNRKTGNDAAAGAMTIEEFDRMIPPIDPTSDDWLSSKATAKRLGVKTKTLSNRRAGGFKWECDGGACGFHDTHCFWRRLGQGHPRYYLPQLTGNAGQLAKRFPKNSLQDLKYLP